MILITGASGNVGREVVKQALALGLNIRATFQSDVYKRQLQGRTSTENIFQCAVGAASRPDIRPMHAPWNCYCQRRRTRSRIPTNGFFSILKLRDLRAAVARMRFSSGSRGGKVAVLKSSSSSCASIVRSARSVSYTHLQFPVAHACPLKTWIIKTRLFPAQASIPKSCR